MLLWKRHYAAPPAHSILKEEQRRACMPNSSFKKKKIKPNPFFQLHGFSPGYTHFTHQHAHAVKLGLQCCNKHVKKPIVTTTSLLDGINAEKALHCVWAQAGITKCEKLEIWKKEGKKPQQRTNFNFSAVFVHMYSDAGSKAGL